MISFNYLKLKKRKQIWCLISKLSLFKFEKENMTKMTQTEVQEIVKIYNIPIAKLRILPKKKHISAINDLFQKIRRKFDL